MDEAVKERSDATPCLDCGGPTWSRDGYCFKCRPARDRAAPPIEPEPEPTELLREPRLDAAGRIAEEIPCRACGYLLQGLEPDGVCPECSTPKAQSIHGDLLRFCDPDWLRRIASGLLVVVLGLVFWVLFSIVFSAIAFRIAVTGSGATLTTVSVGLSAGALGITAIIVLGMWWLTTPDPGRTGVEPPITARKLARWCVLAQLVAAPLQLVGQTMTGANPMSPMAATTAGAMASTGVGMALGAVAQVGYVAGLLYLRRLVRRIPRDGMGRQLNLVAWGYGVSQGVGIPYALGVLLLMPTLMGGGGGAPPAGALVFLGLGGCVVALGSLVFGIWALVLVILGRNVIAKVAATARWTWGGDGSDGRVPDRTTPDGAA